MTNITERITIEAHEDKTSKNGKDYTRYSTNKGWMSCFESDVNKELKLLPEGHSIEVEFKESEWQGKTQYAIQTCHPKTANDTPAMNTDVSVPEKEIQRKSVKGTAYEKDPVGLAVEVFNSLRSFSGNDNINNTEIMKWSVTMIKQAQEAFN